MSEEMLIQQCSPTLAGIKTANLFSCSYTDEEELKNCIGCWRVYGDIEASQKMFKKFKKCPSVYWDQFKKGRSVDKLTVAG